MRERKKESKRERKRERESKKERESKREKHTSKCMFLFQLKLSICSYTLISINIILEIKSWGSMSSSSYRNFFANFSNSPKTDPKSIRVRCFSLLSLCGVLIQSVRTVFISKNERDWKGFSREAFISYPCTCTCNLAFLVVSVVNFVSTVN